MQLEYIKFLLILIGMFFMFYAILLEERLKLQEKLIAMYEDIIKNQDNVATTNLDDYTQEQQEAINRGDWGERKDDVFAHSFGRNKTNTPRPAVPTIIGKE